jgi:hypothetical protein
MVSMAKMRYRKPSPKTLLGWTKLKKRLKKALGINVVLKPFRAVNNYKRRMLRRAGYYRPEMKMVRAAQRKQVPGPIGVIQLGEREGKEQKQGGPYAEVGALMMAAALGKRNEARANDGRNKNGIGAKLAGDFLLGTALNKERQKSAAKANHVRAHANGHAHTAVKQQEAVQEKPNQQPEPQPSQKESSPRGRGPLILLLVMVLGVIGLLWLNAHLAPENMLHVHLNAGGQGSHFLQFTLQQGQRSLIQISLDALRILLVLTIAVVETLLIALGIDRASPLRLIASLFWSLVGIGAATLLVPLVWRGDYRIDGVPFFTTIGGALVALLVFHLLPGGASKAAVPLALPTSQEPIPDYSGGTLVAPVPVAAPTAVVPGVQLLFHSQRAGIDPSLVEQLVSFILATEHSLDGAIYDLRHPQVLQALATVAHRKRLRLAVDAGKGKVGADPKSEGNQKALQQAGLSSFATSVHEGSHLMHDKFLIRDGRTVWTGSANFTSGGLELQDNNCLMIDSPELAQQYEATFLDLISSHHEHASVKGRSFMGQPVRLGEVTITPGFAPAAGTGIEQMVMSLLKGASKVRIMAFLIGDAGILDALGQVRHADVKGIYDPSGMEDVLRSSRQDRSHFWFLHDSRFVAAPSHAFHANGEQDFMHNKVFIINDEWVVTGSYNFSENAEANDENVLQIHSPAIAAAYNAYFDALYTLYRQHPGHLNEPQKNQRHQPGERRREEGKRQARRPGVLNLFQRR